MITIHTWSRHDDGFDLAPESVPPMAVGTVYLDKDLGGKLGLVLRVGEVTTLPDTLDEVRASLAVDGYQLDEESEKDVQTLLDEANDSA